MRNALILLVVVALIIVTAGAVNHSVAFDVDWVAGTWRVVSLFWVATAIALVVLVAGLAAALLARRGAVRAQRKLEIELDVTYRRVRELESLTPAAAVAPAGDASASAAAAQTAVQASSTVQGQSAQTADALAPEVASAGPAPIFAPQTPAPEPPAAGETTVTVVAAHGSARVTQVLTAPAEPEAPEPKSVGPGPDEAAAGDATAVTRATGDAVGSTGVDEPGAPAADASDGEAVSPD